METTNNIGKRAAIYCRVSTTEQLDGYSIDEQQELVLEMCRNNGYEVIDIYSDRGISAKNIDGRPELKRLLRDASNSKFDIVISWKISRISRNLRDLLNIIEDLERYSVRIKFISDDVDTTTPAGRLQLQLLGMVSEFERENISANVRMGMNARAKDGLWCGGKVMGYDSIKIDENGKSIRILKVNENEADTVRTIFDLYVSGKGYKAIVSQINAMGLRTKKKTQFSVGTVRTILMNPVYIGKIRFGVNQGWSKNRRRNKNPNPIIAEGRHDAIITQETWDKVQSIMKVRGGKRARVYDDYFPLTGILRCPECGAGMVISRVPGAGGIKIPKYSCGAWKNKGTSVCHNNSIKAEDANAYVFDKIKELLSNDRVIRNVVKKINKENIDKEVPYRKTYDKVVKDLNTMEGKKRKLFEAFEEDLINKSEFMERKEQQNSEIRQLEEQKHLCLEVIDQCGGEQISYEEVKEILAGASGIFNNGNRDEVKLLLHMMIDKITIGHSRQIDTIHIKLNDDLIDYLGNSGGASDEDASLFKFEDHVQHRNINIKFAM